MQQDPAGIQHLPAEVLQRILVFSRSSEFPVVCRHFRQVCHNANLDDKAEFIFGRWMDRFVAFATAHPCRKHKACKNAANRLAAIERQDEADSFELTDCIIKGICVNHLDVVTFAAKSDVCTVKVLKRVVFLAKVSLPPSLANCVLPLFERACPRPENYDPAWAFASRTGAPLPRTQLPKRLFRRMAQSDDPASLSSSAATETAPEQSRPRKRRRRHQDAIADEATLTTVAEEEEEQLFPECTRTLAQLKDLVWSVAKVPPYTEIEQDPTSKSTLAVSIPGLEDKVASIAGPMPSPKDLDMILTLLVYYSADGGSHEGYPLAMAAHHRAYALAHLLLLFGAHPRDKEELAVQLAIRNGSQDILHLFVTGPYHSNFVDEALGVLPTLSPAGPLRLDQTHLRLAIECRQWDLVDYIWHEQQVAPDMSCLRLLDRNRR